MAPIGRQKQPEKQKELLDACTSYALEYGLPDRIEPMAEAVGSSSRMLIYHLGPRDEMLHSILVEARKRQMAAFISLLEVRPEQSYWETLENAWTLISGPEGQPYIQMFTRLRDNDGQPLWPGFKRRATTDWLEPLESGLATVDRPELATVVLALIRGLLMDLDATGDSERANRAFKEFIAAVK